MANVIAITVIQINSNYKLAALDTKYFGSAGLYIQSVAAPGNVVNGVTVLSAVKSSATGDTVFYSPLTAAAIQTLANA